MIAITLKIPCVRLSYLISGSDFQFFSVLILTFEEGENEYDLDLVIIISSDIYICMSQVGCFTNEENEAAGVLKYVVHVLFLPR